MVVPQMCVLNPKPFTLLLLFVRSQYSSLGYSPEKFSYSQSECCPENVDALCRGLQQSCDICAFRSGTSDSSVGGVFEYRLVFPLDSCTHSWPDYSGVVEVCAGSSSAM